MVRRWYGVIVLAVLSVALPGVSDAIAEQHSYRYSLDIRSGEPKYAGPLDPSVTTGVRYDVETDAQGRIVRVKTFRDGQEVGAVVYTFSGNAALPTGYDVLKPVVGKTSRVTITRNAAGDRIRQDYYALDGKLTSHLERTYAADRVDETDYNAAGEKADVYQGFFSPAGILIRERWYPAGSSGIYYESERDPATGLTTERKKFSGGKVVVTDRYTYDANSSLERVDLVDPDGKKYGSRSYANGLNTTTDYTFTSGTSKQLRFSYDKTRTTVETAMYLDGQLVLRFVYDRQSNGYVTRTRALTPGGVLVAEYPDRYVEDLDAHLHPLDAPTVGIVHKPRTVLCQRTDGDEQTGRGRCVFPDGSRYEGPWRSGKMDGHGAYVSVGGARYEGDFRDDKFDGRGKQTFVSGNAYEGDFRNGQFDGRGVYTFKDGGRYEGELRNGDFNGHGIEIFANGNRYEGDFRDDKFNGRGVLTYATGGRYEGDFRDGTFDGHGVEIWPDRTRYEGDFKNGKFDGHGVYTFPDGGRYDGELRDGNFNGRGVQTFANGNRYEGDFRDDKFSGRGVFIFASGSRYEGDFLQGKPNGSGTYSHAGGQVYTGSWSNGCFRQGNRWASVLVTAKECGFQ